MSHAVEHGIIDRPCNLKMGNFTKKKEEIYISIYYIQGEGGETIIFFFNISVVYIV